jgi:ABC-type phosphate transport system permease subunit
MKYLKIFFTFVLAVVMFNTNNAASVTTASSTTSTSWHVMPKNQVKKEKVKKNKTLSKKQIFKKMLGGGGMSPLLAILLCIFLAPLSCIWVGIYTGWEGSAWIITLILTLLFVLPAVIYGIIVILSN